MEDSVLIMGTGRGSNKSSEIEWPLVSHSGRIQAYRYDIIDDEPTITMIAQDLDKELDAKNFSGIYRSLQSLNDLQQRMDNIIAEYPIPSASPKNRYLSSQIPAGLGAAVASSLEEEDAIMSNDGTSMDVTGSQDGSEEEANKKMIKELVLGHGLRNSFVKSFERDTRAELVLKGALCSMFGVIFAAGILTT